MTTLREKIASLSVDRQSTVSARAQALVLEESSLRDARKASGKTQVDVAHRLGAGQDSVSRLEQRKDMLVSTLRSYVAALGGNVRVIVEFEDRAPVELKDIGRVFAPDVDRAPSGAHATTSSKRAGRRAVQS